MRLELLHWGQYLLSDLEKPLHPFHAEGHGLKMKRCWSSSQHLHTEASRERWRSEIDEAKGTVEVQVQEDPSKNVKKQGADTGPTLTPGPGLGPVRRRLVAGPMQKGPAESRSSVQCLADGTRLDVTGLK